MMVSGGSGKGLREVVLCFVVKMGEIGICLCVDGVV